MSSRRGGSRRGYAAPRAALVADSRNPSGRGNGRGQSSHSGFQSRFGQPAPITPPLQHGWRGRSDLIPTFGVGHPEQEDMSGCPPSFNSNDDSGKENSDLDYCDDDDDNDDYSSDESQKSHGTRKNHKQFKDFFKLFDSLSLEQLNEPERDWHCAACQGGPGAVDWFRGLQPLMNHAKNKKSARARLHRELAELLDEELRRRGTSVISAGQAFGEWKGLAVRDREIVWPPMVIIMNTQLDKDENGKWRGMGNPEFREYFELYDSVKVKHSYGPQGHRGISVLVFETSAVGFLQSEHLSKHFEVQGTGREDWERRPVKFLPGGKRQLYGYMAEKADVEFFNKHSQGKSRLKFEMRSYEEMVMSQIKKMGEDNQQLLWYKYKVVTEKMHSKTLEKSLDKVTEQLRKKSAENCIIKQRSKMHHEQIKEEMEYLEKFNEEQVKFYEAQQEEKENNFEKLQQEEREKVTQHLQSPSSEDQQSRLEKVEKFINLQNKDMDEFAEERDMLLKEKEMKKAALRKKYLQDDVALEEEYDVKLTRLIEKFTPPAQSNEGK